VQDSLVERAVDAARQLGLRLPDGIRSIEEFVGYFSIAAANHVAGQVRDRRAGPEASRFSHAWDDDGFSPEEV